VDLFLRKKGLGLLAHFRLKEGLGEAIPNGLNLGRPFTRQKFLLAP